MVQAVILLFQLCVSDEGQRCCGKSLGSVDCSSCTVFGARWTEVQISATPRNG